MTTPLNDPAYLTSLISEVCRKTGVGVEFMPNKLKFHWRGMEPVILSFDDGDPYIGFERTMWTRQVLESQLIAAIVASLRNYDKSEWPKLYALTNNQ